jgi:hypothetical protein
MCAAREVRGCHQALHRCGPNPLKNFLRVFGGAGLYECSHPTMNTSDPKESLSRALADWRVAPSRDPGFRAEVQARIQAERHAPGWAGYVRAHGALIAAALMLAVGLGAWSGRAQAQQRDAAARAALVADYVHGLDARWMRLP